MSKFRQSTSSRGSTTQRVSSNACRRTQQLTPTKKSPHLVMRRQKSYVNNRYWLTSIEIPSVYNTTRVKTKIPIRQQPPPSLPPSKEQSSPKKLAIPVLPKNADNSIRLNHVSEHLVDVQILIDGFQGVKTDHLYKYLDEMLLSFLMILDDLEVEKGSEEQEIRKTLYRAVNKCEEKLEAKGEDVEEAVSAEDYIEVRPLDPTDYGGIRNGKEQGNYDETSRGGGSANLYQQHSSHGYYSSDVQQTRRHPEQSSDGYGSKAEPVVSFQGKWSQGNDENRTNIEEPLRNNVTKVRAEVTSPQNVTHTQGEPKNIYDSHSSNIGQVSTSGRPIQNSKGAVSAENATYGEQRRIITERESQPDYQSSNQEQNRDTFSKICQQIRPDIEPKSYCDIPSSNFEPNTIKYAGNVYESSHVTDRANFLSDQQSCKDSQPKNKTDSYSSNSYSSQESSDVFPTANLPYSMKNTTGAERKISYDLLSSNSDKKNRKFDRYVHEPRQVTQRENASREQQNKATQYKNVTHPHSYDSRQKSSNMSKSGQTTSYGVPRGNSSYTHGETEIMTQQTERSRNRDFTDNVQPQRSLPKSTNQRNSGMNTTKTSKKEKCTNEYNEQQGNASFVSMPSDAFSQDGNLWKDLYNSAAAKLKRAFGRKSEKKRNCWICEKTRKERDVELTNQAASYQSQTTPTRNSLQTSTKDEERKRYETKSRVVTENENRTTRAVQKHSWDYNAQMRNMSLRDNHY